MGQPATLVVDIETVGQDPETIPARAREILLDVETDEERTKVLDCLGLDPCTGRIICIGSVVGLAPLGYLTTWRMRLAQRALREEDTPVSEVAASLGYGSESAFSQAFKRVTGARPRDWRKAARGQQWASSTVGSVVSQRS